MAAYILVFITAGSFEEAENVGKILVEKRLAACVNILRNVQSIFWWKDSLETEQEVLLIAKSRAEVFPEIVSTVKVLHSYDVPEIVAIPVISGSEEYLHWIDSEMQPTYSK